MTIAEVKYLSSLKKSIASPYQVKNSSLSKRGKLISSISSYKYLIADIIKQILFNTFFI